MTFDTTGSWHVYHNYVGSIAMFTSHDFYHVCVATGKTLFSSKIY